jgi:DNA-binding transcriptional regulator YiaG
MEKDVMAKTKKCRECGAEMRTEVRDHHFVESGLENVWIEGVTVHVCPNGHELLAIPALGQVHRVLALAIISNGQRLTGPEVKYLRKYLGLSNQDFAKVMKVSESTASRWANGEDMGGSAENLLRLLVRRGEKPEAYPVDELAYLKGLAENSSPRGRIALKRRSDRWQAEASA